MLYRVMGLIIIIEMQQGLNLSREHGLEAAENQYAAIWICMEKVGSIQSYPIEKSRTLIWGTITTALERIGQQSSALVGLDVLSYHFIFRSLHVVVSLGQTTGLIRIKEYEMAMWRRSKVKDAYLAKMADAINENSVTPATTAADLDGRKGLQTYCAACHLETGAGNVGPNLTDEYWIHGGIKNVFKTIKYNCTCQRYDFVEGSAQTFWNETLPATSLPCKVPILGERRPHTGWCLEGKSAAATPAAADTYRNQIKPNTRLEIFLSLVLLNLSNKKRWIDNRERETTEDFIYATENLEYHLPR